jgi:hypothetical protein
MHLTHIVRYLTATVLMAGAAAAQTTTPTPTPTTANPCPSSTAPTLVSFTLERALIPTNISSTATPTFPTGLQPALNTQTMELRQSVNFNAANNLLTLNLFPVQSGAPTPTPIGNLTPTSIFDTLAIKVDKVYTTCTPVPSVMFVGTVATNSPATLFGNLSGAPVAVSVGLTEATTTGTTPPTTPPTINDVAVLIAGRALEYSTGATATINFAASSVTPPGTTGGPNIVVASVGPTAFRIIDLDASASTGSGTLSFQWSVVAGAASINTPTNVAHTTAFIEGGAGTYTFRVTVTDSQGNVSTKDVNVQFL